jgi:hypothetical protein
MNAQQKKSFKQLLRIITLTVWVVLFLGCAANKNADLKRPASRRIIDIAISETSDSLLFIIKGDQSLKYTEKKQTSPLGVVIRFPDTTMDIFERVYIPPPNEVIRSVTADEVVEDYAATSYIFIGFQKDTPYEVTAEGNALQVVFPKAPALSKDAGVQKEFAQKKSKESAAKRPASKSVALSVAAATRLKKVTVTPQNDHLVVKVEADGNIKNYKRFAMRQPARIIIDMYDLTSPYKQEKIIAVDSTWLKQARYYGHSNKVRLVLETHPQYLANYTVRPVDNGLIIRIGGDAVVSTRAARRKGKSEIVLGDGPGGHHITLNWDNAPNATSYNIYWRNSPGVTKRNGKKITNLKNSVKISGLKAGMTYYFVVTTVSGSQESDISEEMSYTAGE